MVIRKNPVIHTLDITNLTTHKVSILHICVSEYVYFKFNINRMYEYYIFCITNICMKHNEK